MEQQDRAPRLAKLSEKNREIFGTIGILLAAIVLAFGLTSFVVQSYQVDGQSMETTLQNGDRLIVDKRPRTLARITKHAYIPHRGDIIIFNQSGLNFGSNSEKQLIKRVIGLPGDRVVVQNGTLTVYNDAYPQGYQPDKTDLYHIDALTTPGNVDIRLQANEIFVSGDNRANSEDSRYFGPVNVNNIVGKLAVRILPLNKAKRF